MSSKRREVLIYALGLCSLLALSAALLLARRPFSVKTEMLFASRRMEQAVAAVRGCRERRGVGIDPAADINRTGLIGLETSPITTSLGNLEAKRTTVNPNFAGLITLLLHRAGVRKGDTIAIGASSSFPGLIIASLCAVEALELRGLMICSLGASQWGANNPEFNWLDIMSCLESAHFLSARPVALSLGGDKDAGEDMSPEGRALLLRSGRQTGLPFVAEPELKANVRERLRLLEAAAGGTAIRAFINVGGGYADMGTDSSILKVGPGLAEFSAIPPRDRRGLIFEMAARRVPVIHLLYVKGLCDRFGLPWDPAPLPAPGRGGIIDGKEVDRRGFLILAGAYFLLAAAVLLIGVRL
jgi:poly-gamma-glutamate system protein